MNEPTTSHRGLFGPVLSRGDVFAATTDAAWLQAMLDAEAALAAAQADVGLGSAAHAAVVAAACRAEAFDVEALGRGAVDGANPVIPLVRALSAAVAAVDPSAAQLVHRGATSQDIVDTAAMLVSRAALAVLVADLRRAVHRAAQLADTHRHLAMAGRTLGQHAAPITFGLKAAGWTSGLVAAGRRAERALAELPAVQLGGAVGTLSVHGPSGPAVLAAFARRVGLAEPVLPWHTERSRIAELAGVLGLVAGAAAKVAADVVLLAQTEVAEVRDTAAGRGGSSAMPHKRNPVAAVSVLAAARTVPGEVATLLASMAHEHERAAGAWHAEWLPLIAALRSSGSAVTWLVDVLEHLEPVPTAMAANLARTGGLLYAEAAAAALAPALGRLEAQRSVEQACSEALADGRPLRVVLGERPEVVAALGEAGLDAAFSPVSVAGSTDTFIDRALADARAFRVARASAPGRQSST